MTTRELIQELAKVKDLDGEVVFTSEAYNSEGRLEGFALHRVCEPDRALAIQAGVKGEQSDHTLIRCFKLDSEDTKVALNGYFKNAGDR